MNTNFLTRIVIVGISAAVFLTSCTKDEERLTASDSADVISESLTDAYFEDVDDMAIVAVESEDSPSGGRIAGDDRFCAGLLIGENSSVSSGRLTINFGAGCTDPRGNVRMGKVILEYSDGPAGTVGFTVVTSFENYYINGVKLEGTRTIELLSNTQASIKHEITVANGKATWADNSVSTRTSTFVREIDLSNQLVKLEGNASGTNRVGREYSMTINETLVYKRSCVLSDGIYMAVGGVKTFNSAGRKLTINYGDGSCDRTCIISVGDYSTSINVDGI
jgi:hypothetical protein